MKRGSESTFDFSCGFGGSACQGRGRLPGALAWLHLTSPSLQAPSPLNVRHRPSFGCLSNSYRDTILKHTLLLKDLLSQDAAPPTLARTIRTKCLLAAEPLSTSRASAPTRAPETWPMSSRGMSIFIYLHMRLSRSAKERPEVPWPIGEMWRSMGSLPFMN